MPPEVFVVTGCHCGALIRSNLRSFEVDQACTPVAGAAQSNELRNAARETVAAAVVFKNFRRVLDSICALIVVSKYPSLQGIKSNHQYLFGLPGASPVSPCSLCGRSSA